MAQPEYTIEVEIITETEKAYKVDSDGDIVWLPKSQIRVHSLGETEKVKLTIPAWLYKESFPDDIIS